jgi:geranylgeranyl diphosphate synthase type I
VIITRAEGYSDNVGGYIRRSINAEFDEYISNVLLHLFDETKGLRVRPFIFRAAYSIKGSTSDEILPFAGGIELVQVSTLVKDDIFDDAGERDGRKSINARYGTRKAIIVAELLKSLAVKSLCRCYNFPKWAEAVECIEDGYLKLYIGQFLDIESEGVDISEDDYIDIIQHTVGYFFRASAVAGALMGGLDNEEVNAIQRFGLQLGIAFQIRDDIIDVIADEEEIGKPVGGDIRLKKQKLPLLYAYELSTPSEQRSIRRIFEKDKLNDDDVQEVIQFIVSSGSIEKCIETVKGYCDNAVKELDVFSDTEPVNDLRYVAELISTFE